MSSTINTNLKERARILILPSHLVIHKVRLKGLRFVDLLELGIENINLVRIIRIFHVEWRQKQTYHCLDSVKTDNIILHCEIHQLFLENKINHTV